MQTKTQDQVILVFGIIGPALLAIGAWIPVVKSTHGHTYSIVGNPALMIYGIAALILALNVVADKISAPIAKRLQLVAIVMLLGCLIHGINVSDDGTKWFNVQTAYDAPGWEKTDKDAYWQKLYQYGYGENLWLVGNLRRAYETYGPGVELNNQAIFRDTINSLTQEQAKDLTSAAKVDVQVIPFGIVAFVASFVVQLLILVSLHRRREQ